MELLQYHTHVLEHMGNARWELSTVQDYQERTAVQQRPKGSQSAQHSARATGQAS